MSEKRELSRAEQVRLRSRKKLQQRPTQSVQSVTRSMPAVTSRSFVATKHTVNTRRRFQAAFTMSGVQVSMPSISLPRVEVSWRLASFSLSLVLGVMIYFAWTLPTFRVSAASVTGNQRLSANEINAVLGSTGQPIFTLVPADLETRLRLNYPELASVKVSVDLPNVVTIKVTERQPVILWQQNGGYTWIDNSGVAFRPRGSVDNLVSVIALVPPAPGDPSVNDPLSPAPFMSTDLVKGIQALAPNLPPGTSMIYDAQYGLGWADGRGWQVFFGSTSKDIALKLQVYQALVASVTSRGITPAFISVQYANAPFYRMSK